MTCVLIQFNDQLMTQMLIFDLVIKDLIILFYVFSSSIWYIYVGKFNYMTNDIYIFEAKGITIYLLVSLYKCKQICISLFQQHNLSLPQTSVKQKKLILCSNRYDYLFVCLFAMNFSLSLTVPSR